MKLALITDIDLYKDQGAGIASYVKNLLDHPERKDLKIRIVGKGTGKKPLIDADETLSLGDCKSNLAFLRRLSAKSMMISRGVDVIFAQRPDFLYPFRNKKMKKVSAVHGNPMKVISEKKPWIISSIYRFLEKRGINAADKIIFIDSRTMSEYSRWYPEDAIKFILIPNCINLDSFYPIAKEKARKKIGLDPKKKTLLFAGRLEPEKNPVKMIHEFIGSGIDADFLILGDGRMKAEVEKAASGSERIYVKGLIQPSLMKHYYNSADAFILMSGSEGLPSVILESLACGTPVIAKDAGDIKDLVIDGKTGYMIDFGGIKTAFENILKKSSWKEACRAKAREYSWGKISSRIYKELYS